MIQTISLLSIENTAFFSFNASSILRPFESLPHYLGFSFILLLILLFSTSFYYFFLRSALAKAEDGDKSPVHYLVILFAVVTGLIFYFVARLGLHSLFVDPYGQSYYLICKDGNLSLMGADFFLVTASLGFAACWMRIFQIMLIDDISERFYAIIATLPYMSGFMLLGILSGLWFFFSNIFPLWWYVLSFTVIYGAVMYCSWTAFQKQLQLHLSRSTEYEENFSLKTLSILGAIILIIFIVLPHILYKTLPWFYILIQFVMLLLAVIFMTPGKLFRKLKNYSRYTNMTARVLNLARYFRQFLLFWAFVFIVFAFILSMGMFFEPGLSSPVKNFGRCANNVKMIGEALEGVMRATAGSNSQEKLAALPDSRSWEKGSWVYNLKTDRKLKIMPPCPSGGKYILRKWIDPKNGMVVFQVRCSQCAHTKAGVEDFYPRYDRNRGLIKKQENKPDRR
ncbi:MAG: hypothetical protein LWY06_12880 [Firmicutes bacterium]|nr:hypothetical protein [Bacillota bacterium]